MFETKWNEPEGNYVFTPNVATLFAETICQLQSDLSSDKAHQGSSALQHQLVLDLQAPERNRTLMRQGPRNPTLLHASWIGFARRFAESRTTFSTLAPCGVPRPVAFRLQTQGPVPFQGWIKPHEEKEIDGTWWECYYLLMCWCVFAFSAVEGCLN